MSKEKEHSSVDQTRENVGRENVFTPGDATAQRWRQTLAALASVAFLSGSPSGEGKDYVQVPSYKEVVENLYESTYHSQEEKGAIFVSKDDQPLKPITIKSGDSSSVDFLSDLHQLRGVLDDHGNEVQMIHTHPVSIITEKDLREGSHAVSSSENIPIPPSPLDWGLLLTMARHFPPDQLRSKVIDGRGTWEYGIADSGNPFVQHLDVGEFSPVWMDEPLTIDDKDAINRVLDEADVDEFKRRWNSDPELLAIQKKLNAIHILSDDTQGEYATREDVKNIEILINNLPKPGATERELWEDYQRRQEAASQLGLYIHFTPHPGQPDIGWGKSSPPSPPSGEFSEEVPQPAHE